MLPQIAKIEKVVDTTQQMILRNVAFEVKYEGGQWKQISLTEFPAELSNTNVIVGRPPSDLLNPLYKVADVQEKNYYLSPEYKAILREALSQERINQMCQPMVHYKCGWFGARPDGTFNQEFADRMCNR